MILLLTDIKNPESIDLDLGSVADGEVKYEGEKAVLNVFTSAVPSKEVLDKVKAIVLCLEIPSFVIKEGGSIKDIEVDLWNSWIKAFRNNCKAPIFIRYKPNYAKRGLIYNTEFTSKYGKEVLTAIPGTIGCIKDEVTYIGPGLKSVITNVTTGSDALVSINPCVETSLPMDERFAIEPLRPAKSIKKEEKSKRLLIDC